MTERTTSEAYFRSPARVQNPRAFQRFNVDSTSVTLDVMVYRLHLCDKRPLVIIHSIEYPMPPSEAFCERMWRAGYQVIFVRRPGFGGSQALPPPLLEDEQVHSGAAAVSEAALLSLLLKSLALEDIVLLSVGSANAICYRLCKLNQSITFSVFANTVFNQDIWDVFRPSWLRSMLRQTLVSKSGMKIATHGLQTLLKTRPIWFYKQFVQKSAGDLQYISENEPDITKAAEILQNIADEFAFYDIRMSLVPDPLLKDSYFEDIDAVVLSGSETSFRWQTRLVEEAERLSLPVQFATSGDVFVPYSSPDALLAVLPAVEQPAQSKPFTA